MIICTFIIVTQQEITVRSSGKEKEFEAYTSMWASGGREIPHRLCSVVLSELHPSNLKALTECAQYSYYETSKSVGCLMNVPILKSLGRHSVHGIQKRGDPDRNGPQEKFEIQGVPSLQSL